jgi:hypothetical protein
MKRDNVLPFLIMLLIAVGVGASFIKRDEWPAIAALGVLVVHGLHCAWRFRR